MQSQAGLQAYVGLDLSKHKCRITHTHDETIRTNSIFLPLMAYRELNVCDVSECAGMTRRRLR